jgi:hypothetical protein
VAAHFAGAELGSAEPGPDAAALLEAQKAGFAAALEFGPDGSAEPAGPDAVALLEAQKAGFAAALEFGPDGSAEPAAPDAVALPEAQKAGFAAALEFGPDGSAQPAAPGAVAPPEAQKDAVLAPGWAMLAQEPRARANPGLACLAALRADLPVVGPAHCLRVV